MNRIKPGLVIIWKILWKSLSFFALWSLLMVPLIVPFTPKINNWKETHPLLTELYFNLVGLVTILAATIIMVRYIDRRSLGTIGFNLSGAARDLILGLITGTAWITITSAVAWMLGWISFQDSGAVGLTLFISSAAFVLLNVMTQQLLLNGYVFQTIRKHTNSVAAVLISAALFVGYHAGFLKGDLLPMINLFSAGTLFCLAYLISGKLWLSTGIHFAWNFILGSVLGLVISGQNQPDGGFHIMRQNVNHKLAGGSFGIEGSIIVTVTSLAIVLIMFSLLRNKRDKKVKPDAGVLQEEKVL